MPMSPACQKWKHTSILCCRQSEKHQSGLVQEAGEASERPAARKDAPLSFECANCAHNPMNDIFDLEDMCTQCGVDSLDGAAPKRFGGSKRIVSHEPSSATAKFADGFRKAPEDAQREIMCRQQRRTIKNGAVYFTMCEVQRHTSRNSCWCVAGGNVYDVTRFLELHPAGSETILECAGGIDCTRDFNFHSKSAQQLLSQFYIGMLRKCPVCESGESCLIC
jgi:cytochrome b involved in lipid metabolism